MAVSLTRENYVLHKLHSLTGVLPTGFYMLQHLTLNSFTLAGPKQFDSVIHFFEGIPKHLLLGIEIFVLWLPILFHSIYGIFIVGRAQPNMFAKKYGWSQNRMYTFQRWSGVFLFFFLLFHVVTTTGAKYMANSAEPIMYAAMSQKFQANGYALTIFYALGILAASYHLSYGIWNFCIRWGITINERSQLAIQKFSAGMFLVVTMLGWGALAGFLIHR